jgi:hypothetical protein
MKCGKPDFYCVAIQSETNGCRFGGSCEHQIPSNAAERIIGEHWLEVALSRIRAGESEAAVMADYDWVRKPAPSPEPGDCDTCEYDGECIVPALKCKGHTPSTAHTDSANTTPANKPVPPAPEPAPAEQMWICPKAADKTCVASGCGHNYNHTHYAGCDQSGVTGHCPACIPVPPAPQYTYYNRADNPDEVIREGDELKQSWLMCNASVGKKLKECKSYLVFIRRRVTP